MQRLRDRLGDERGAVNVVAALLLVPMMGFLSISVDVAAMWADKQQLQTGADAGAFAIAATCGAGSCGDPQATASALAVSNKNDGAASATIPVLTANQVTVQTATQRAHWFAPVLGVNSTTITATSTVAWGLPTGGTAVLPMVLSLCEWKYQLSQPSQTLTIPLSKSSSAGCTNNSGNHVPGGFGWLEVTTGICEAASSVGGQVISDPGKSVPHGCTGADLAALQNRTILLPIFDQTGEQGSKAWYRVYGYAAFTITGYNLVAPGGGGTWNSTCSGNDSCIHGRFIDFVDVSDAFTYQGTNPTPDMGAFVARMILPEPSP